MCVCKSSNEMHRALEPHEPNHPLITRMQPSSHYQSTLSHKYQGSQLFLTCKKRAYASTTQESPSDAPSQPSPFHTSQSDYSSRQWRSSRRHTSGLARSECRITRHHGRWSRRARRCSPCRTYSNRNNHLLASYQSKQQEEAYSPTKSFMKVCSRGESCCAEDGYRVSNMLV
jgi:hypothetical protein